MRLQGTHAGFGPQAETDRGVCRTDHEGAAGDRSHHRDPLLDALAPIPTPTRHFRGLARYVVFGEAKPLTSRLGDEKPRDAPSLGKRNVHHGLCGPDASQLAHVDERYLLLAGHRPCKPGIRRTKRVGENHLTALFLRALHQTAEHIRRLRLQRDQHAVARTDLLHELMRPVAGDERLGRLPLRRIVEDVYVPVDVVVVRLVNPAAKRRLGAHPLVAEWTHRAIANDNERIMPLRGLGDNCRKNSNESNQRFHFNTPNYLT